MAWYDDHLSDEMVLKLARQMDRAIMEMICAGCDRTPKLSDATIEDFVPDIRRSIDREWGDMTRVTFTGVI